MAPIEPECQRAFAVDIIRRLRAAGYEAYWAGGCVRDQLLGRLPNDYDVATSATPAQVRRVFGLRHTRAIGAAFGVITVLGPERAGSIEVATFREDDDYRDGRHPVSVRFSTAKIDAQRRDFTINGLFYDPQADRVIDFVGGQADLQQRLIRAIGNPRARFDEDRLRMLRAVRFAATFQFQLEQATHRAIQEMAAGISLVSAERIGTEMQLMLLHAARADAVEVLRGTGLLGVLLPELEAACAGADGRVRWRETLRVLAALREPELPLALAALLHQTGSVSLVEEVGRRWRLPKRHTQRAAWLVANLHQVDQATAIAWPRLQRLLICDDVHALLGLYEAMAGVDSPALAFCRARLALPPEVLNPPPLVTGDDLIAHGMKPGKAFHWLLDQLRDAQLNQVVTTRGEALELAGRLLAETRNGPS
ncbi:MAG: hypothetical protein A2W31_05305 [Planctomycetes bacterium RBG_16_64_10]|nr:MAG: hypothetical protein A2W31_05305 [Planctomycetes bacterium RBG_16_64_10]